MTSQAIFRRGEAVTFTAKTNRRFKATIADGKISEGKVAVLLSGDPYPVRVKVVQVQREGADVSPTKTTKAPEMRKLAKEARLLGIKGYENMKAAELRRAIKDANEESEDRPARKPKAKSKPASKAKTTKSKATGTPKSTSSAKSKAAAKPASKKSTTRKPAAKKAAAPKSTAAKKAPAKKAPATSKASSNGKAKSTNTGPNPFRERSNLHLMTEELMKGGKLQTVVNRLKKKMEIKPWSKDEVEDVDKAITKRVHLAAASLEKDHGFKIVKEGRGPSSKIQAIPPKKGGRKK